MTLTEDKVPSTAPLYSIKNTEDRGRAVYASRCIPSGTTVHIASQPFVSVIKEQFKKEVCAWCFTYRHGKNCLIKHPDTRTGVNFCSVDCFQQWTLYDFDGKLASVLASLRTNTARKVISQSIFDVDAL